MLAAGVSSARRRTGMQGSLGEKIGEGVFADVHAWAPGQVVKLSKPGIPQWVVQHETQMTRAVFAAGGPAPEVLGEVTLDGRFGIVLPRFDGPTLRQATRTGAITRRTSGRNPCDALPCRSQDATAAGRTLAARGDGRQIAVRRQRASGAHHHRRPRADRAPRAR